MREAMMALILLFFKPKLKINFLQALTDDLNRSVGKVVTYYSNLFNISV